jgi:hypothetical protein
MMSAAASWHRVSAAQTWETRSCGPWHVIFLRLIETLKKLVEKDSPSNNNALFVQVDQNWERQRYYA